MKRFIMRKILLTLLSIVLYFTINGNVWSQEVLTSEIFDYETLNASIMRPDIETLLKWQKDEESAPKAFIDEEINLRLVKLQSQGLGSSLSLLSYLDYVPSERSQGNCGNCWVWASTGVIEIAHNVQNGVKDRLATQFLDSCKTDKYACCGGNPVMFADWYRIQGFVIPWSNTNGFFQDGNTTCSTGLSGQSCSAISINPNYPITSIQAVTVSTVGVGQSTAIANIKNVLNQNKAIYFGFYLPNQSDWNQFQNFWSGASASESNIWNPDFSCGHQWVDGEGGGHAVLLVGYNDDDSNPANHYWIFLNSWGTAGGKRPNGLFRMAMNVNYDCSYPSGSQSFQALRWTTMDIQFGGSSVCTYSINPTSQSFTSSGGSSTVSVTTSSSCSWSATKDVDWITITSGSSGTGNGTLNYTVSANTGSQRKGTLTIAGKTLTVSQDASGTTTNLVKNPGFEQGDNGDWTLNWSDIIWNNSFYSYGGYWLAWLGGYNYALDYIYQDVTIPSNLTKAYVDFMYWIDTYEITTTTVYDKMEVAILRPTDNVLLKSLVILSNLDWTYYWDLSSLYDISEFIGQTIRLIFYTTTDYGFPTSFFLDDIALWAVSSTTQLPMVGSLENPSNGQKVSGITTIGGWALDGKKVTGVALYVDGSYVADIPYGGTRNDVKAVYPQYPNADLSGFGIVVNYSALSSGSHTILVRLYNQDGQTKDLTAIVSVVKFHGEYVTNASPSSYIMSDVNVTIGGVTKTYDITVQWSNGTQGFEIKDSVLMGGSSINLTRENDFNFFLLSPQIVSPLKSSEPLTSLPLIGALENPSNGQKVSGITTIGGWALDGKKVTGVALYVDGSYVADIPYGGTRNDVKAVYPQYPNADLSGFGIVVNYSALSSGSHTILVRLYNQDGQTKDLTAIVSVVKFHGEYVTNLSPGSWTLPNCSITVSGITKNYDIGVQWFNETQGFEITSLTQK